MTYLFHLDPASIFRVRFFQGKTSSRPQAQEMCDAVEHSTNPRGVFSALARMLSAFRGGRLYRLRKVALNSRSRRRARSEALTYALAAYPALHEDLILQMLTRWKTDEVGLSLALEHFGKLLLQDELRGRTLLEQWIQSDLARIIASDKVTFSSRSQALSVLAQVRYKTRATLEYLSQRFLEGRQFSAFCGLGMMLFEPNSFSPLQRQRLLRVLRDSARPNEDRLLALALLQARTGRLSLELLFRLLEPIALISSKTIAACLARLLSFILRKKPAAAVPKFFKICTQIGNRLENGTATLIAELDPRGIERFLACELDKLINNKKASLVCRAAAVSLAVRFVDQDTQAQISLSAAMKSRQPVLAKAALDGAAKLGVASAPLVDALVDGLYHPRTSVRIRVVDTLLSIALRATPEVRRIAINGFNAGLLGEDESSVAQKIEEALDVLERAEN